MRIIFSEGREKAVALSESELQCIEQLYRAHYQRLYLYARAVVQDAGLAEEAVQDTFHIACGRVREVQRSKNSAGWLMQTLKNVIRNMERSRSSLYSSLRSGLPYDDAVLGAKCDEPSVDVLYGGILPEEDFRLLKHIVLDGWSYLEAAQSLSISVDACRKRVQRSKEKLRKKLEV